MKWIKVEDGLPKDDGSYFVRAMLGSGTLSFRNGEWNIPIQWDPIFNQIIEWLDESEPSFSISDMRGLFNHFNNYLANAEGVRFGDQLFTEYLKEKFNIDL